MKQKLNLILIAVIMIVISACKETTVQPTTVTRSPEEQKLIDSLIKDFVGNLKIDGQLVISDSSRDGKTERKTDTSSKSIKLKQSANHPKERVLINVLPGKKSNLIQPPTIYIPKGPGASITCRAILHKGGGLVTGVSDVTATVHPASYTVIGPKSTTTYNLLIVAFQGYYAPALPSPYVTIYWEGEVQMRITVEQNSGGQPLSETTYIPFAKEYYHFENPV